MKGDNMKVDNIRVNFLDHYYMFYDWLDTDLMEKVSGIMLYKVSSKTISDFMNFKIKIHNLNILSKNNIILFSDGFSYVAIEFDNEGKSIFKSSLLLEDENNLYSKVDNLKNTKLSYEKLEKENKIKDLRINEEIRKTIRIELCNLEKNNNKDKLAYLYYEWFNKFENDSQKMLRNMFKKLEMPLTKSEKKVYDLIKKSYKLV